MFSVTGAVCALAMTASEAQRATVIQICMLILSGFHRSRSRAVRFMERVSGKNYTQSVVFWRWLLLFLLGLATSLSLPAHVF